MSNIVLLGLPGLYQNWLMAAVDPASKVQLHGEQNFFCAQSRVKWKIKPGTVEYPIANDQLIILNLYVKEQNFPWYLYNLFEKTYDIRIMVDNLVDDLMSKGEQFEIFNDFKSFLLEIDYHDKNQVINFFYFLFLNKERYLYKDTQFVHESYINIEFDDFNHSLVLEEKLSVIPGFDSRHFNTLYQTLVDRNQRYLNRKKNFLAKIENHQELDIIETAYVGKLATILFDKKLEWHKPAVRNTIIKHKTKEISDLAKELC
jgi:hypothetical protein